MRDLAEFRGSGLLWYLNRVALHPQGLALGLVHDSAGAVIGWDLLPADPGEPFAFDAETDAAGYRAAHETLRAARLSE